ncbi:AAA domain-containing protein [Actinokineospora alba]|uniref:AAA domain-containing protein n=1 Tax=Actinokineospora alba TaxID=504798 RepID=A0A1H0T922_9PSEU|nr:GntR family transcriptional regulator [Actinokineospora alba]TDP66328.1 GntR family transcriptional regulator [Actinokineospora alba]SDJ22086.1 AAA domain-containing protein [Actinokineospora alba]SDP49996.1 AAA domain-containing protein [Actinokineospora alba]
MADPRRSRVPRSESLHQQVARNIRNDIAAGVLRDREPLPSTRALAERWGVSVFTINEAMKILIDEGVVISKPRAGRVVNAPDQAQGNELRTYRPNVVMIGGYAGSGKTELGRILARETGWPMLDKDTLTRPVVEAALEMIGCSPHDRESDAYLSKIRPREYEALASAMTENVQCGSSALVTAPFIREFRDTAWLRRTEATCASMNARLHVIWVYCDAETMHTYVRHRGAARDSVKLADWSAYMAGVDVDFRPEIPHTVIDNRTSGEPLQVQARKFLAAVLEKDG